TIRRSAIVVSATKTDSAGSSGCRTRPWPTISSIDSRDEEEFARVWPATGGARRRASRNAPAFSFHAALIYDLTRVAPSTALVMGIIKHRLIAIKTTKLMPAFTVS